MDGFLQSAIINITPDTLTPILMQYHIIQNPANVYHVDGTNTFQILNSGCYGFTLYCKFLENQYHQLTVHDQVMSQAVNDQMCFSGALNFTQPTTFSVDVYTLAIGLADQIQECRFTLSELRWKPTFRNETQLYANKYQYFPSTIVPTPLVSPMESDPFYRKPFESTISSVDNDNIEIVYDGLKIAQTANTYPCTFFVCGNAEVDIVTIVPFVILTTTTD